jgi:hypothetical protein
MTCGLCRWAGHLFCHHASRREWWPCPGCRGAGARLGCTPSEIRIGQVQGAFLRPDTAGRHP